MKTNQRFIQQISKKLLLLLVINTCLNVFNVQANNIVVSNATLTGQNTSAGVNNSANYTMVKFDLSWENSWRTNSEPFNWDAAWVFVKYRVGSGSWGHATLSNVVGSHTTPSGSTIEVPGDGTGAFIYRSSPGSGTFSLSNIELRWRYRTDGVDDNANVSIMVFAIEMVYVPQGSFYVGSGGTEVGSFTNGSWTSGATIPFQITSEAALGIDNVAGKLWGTSSASLTAGDAIGNLNSDAEATLSASYPKGFAAFYCMKHEISQGQYVAFLNTLTRTQQKSRVATPVAAGTTTVTNRYVMTQSTVVTKRNVIRCNATISSTDTITFYCDRDGDGIGNESDDGEFIAANYLSWADLAAYLDWAALRPMTELEFEKACRGTTASPTPNEYAWGSTTITGATGISNSGLSSEIADNSGANIAYNNATNVQGPLRVGSFAQGSTNRVNAGATYYGILDMSGNLWERTITLGSSTGRAYTGLHGNGGLTTAGNNSVTAWPGTDAIGSGYRGGRWNADTVRLRISDRTGGTTVGNARNQDSGGRGVRTAP